MRKMVIIGFLAGLLTVLGVQADGGATPKSSTGQADQGSIVIVFKDGHTQMIPMASIARMDFNSPSAAGGAGAVIPSSGPLPSRHRFVGKWKLGEGSGGSFIVELKENGEATKSIGASHGTWTYVSGEARITWDDGWHDAIRKAGTKYEKFAYEPGKSFTDKPANVTEAVAAIPEPI